MMRTVVRLVGVVVAVAALGMTTACGGSDDGGGDDGKPAKVLGDDRATTKGPGSGAKALGKARVASAVLESADAKGYAVTRMSKEEFTSAKAPKAKQSKCQPLAALLGSSPDPAPAAWAVSTFGVQDSKAGAMGGMGMLEVSSYEGDGAERTLQNLGKAVRDCAGGFEMTTGAGTQQTYSAVESLDAPKLGDEAVAYRAVDKASGAPSLYTVVRSGANVSMIFAANMMDPAKATMDPNLVKTQVAKVEKAAKATG
ncbi:hypothetical protein WEB32_14995 [Streptomyces netropsis]|nr:hypothetical protein [Streptomyces netropsis]